MTTTLSVAVARRSLHGEVTPFEITQLTRVPAVGECIGSADESSAIFRVTDVLHIPNDQRDETAGDVAAEVWAVEVERRIGFGPVESLGY